MPGAPLQTASPRPEWQLKEKPSAQRIHSLADALGVNASLATLLLQRGVETFDQAKTFFRPSLDQLCDPFAMKDMDKAAGRLARAMEQKERVLVYGDYDVDGVTAVAMCCSFLQKLGLSIDFYIPSRHQEGYGLSRASAARALQGHDLVITLDCGIRSVDAIGAIQGQGVDVIVCDHHEPGATIPPALAVLDPKRPDCAYPYKMLSGCGVAFKLLQAFAQHQNFSLEALYEQLDLVALSIACDLVDLTGENRILAYYGLQRLRDSPRPGIKALMDSSRLLGHVHIDQLVFRVGPRINAPGRIDHAKLSVALLLSKELEQARPLSEAIEAKNAQRRALDARTTAEALAQLECHDAIERKTTVLCAPHWDRGIVGIVAARCVEHVFRPTVVLAASDGIATGSARSVPGFNIYEALTACSDLLIRYGGHAFAAGLSLRLEHVTAFAKRFEEVVQETIQPAHLVPVQPIDLALPLTEIDRKFCAVLQQMGPFGPKNMRPVFVSEHLKASRCVVLREHHLKLVLHTIDNPELTFSAIGFHMAAHAPTLRNGQPFQAAYTLQEDPFDDKRWQFQLKDIHPESLDDDRSTH